MRSSTPTWLVLVTCGLMSACDGTAAMLVTLDGDGGHAGGPSADAGTGLGFDAGAGQGDAGPGDAGSAVVDAGAVFDSGTAVTDAGTSGGGLDAGHAPADAGPDVDGGFGRDAGHASDAGTRDAGGFSADAGRVPLFVAVGNWGRRSRSSDGVTWAECANPTQANDHTPDLLRNVGYGDGVFVAVGGSQNSMVMISTDGLHWEENRMPTDACAGDPYPVACTNWVGGVAYGDGVWVAAGGNGAHMRSTDGARTWKGGSPGLGGSVRDIVFGEGKFVAVGDSGKVWVSTNAGLSWAAQTPTTLDLGKVGFANGVFVAVGSAYNGSGFDSVCLVSTDSAASWHSCSFDYAGKYLGGPGSGDGTLVVPTGGYAQTTDGASWSTSTSRFPDVFAYGNGRWVGVSWGARLAGNAPGALTEYPTTVGASAITFGWVDPSRLDTSVPECVDASH